jgi:hypothetical protein
MSEKAKERLVVYTCVTGGYDELSAPAVLSPDVRYICFTDVTGGVPAPWEVIDIGALPFGAKDNNRYIKMHPHLFLPEHDVSLYIDGSVKIVGDVRALVTATLQSPNDVFLYEHPQRDCIYSEANACAYYGYDWVWNINRQMQRYRGEGFPAHRGLFEAGVILRRNTEKVSELMRYWWTDYTNGVKRDQLSLTVVAWRLGISIGSLGRSDFRFENRYFKFVPHPRRTPVLVFLRQRINRLIERVGNCFSKVTNVHGESR